MRELKATALPGCQDCWQAEGQVIREQKATALPGCQDFVDRAEGQVMRELKETAFRSCQYCGLNRY